MKRFIVATAAAVVLAVPGLVGTAAGQPTPVKDAKIGTRVTITGCLHQGAAKGSFVLLGVTERPAGRTAPGRPVPYAIYWLDSTDGLKPLVGEMVDITGKVTGRRSAAGTITVSVDASEALDTEVKVDSGVRTVTSEKFDATPRPPVATPPDSTLSISRPVYKLAVESVRAVGNMTGPACR